MRPARREMTDAEMRRNLTEVGQHLDALDITGEIVRGYSPDGLSREVQILLEGLFE